MSVLLSSLAVVTLLQTNPSFDQIEALKHQAYRGLKDYREVVQIKVTGEGQSQTIQLAQRLMGSKQRFVATINGMKSLESGHDGKVAWVVSHPQKQYKTWDGPNGTYAAKYAKPDYSKIPMGDFNFFFDSGYNIRFVANPPLKITSRGNVTFKGKKARKIVARAALDGGKRYVQVTQYFMPDRWMLLGFDVEGKGQQAGVFRINAVVTESSFAAGSTAGQFRLDKNMVKGYTKTPN